MLRSLLVMAFALAWIAASGDVHAAKKDKSMCDGVANAAKGVCTAAAALGCGTSNKHQKQCDVLGDKFEVLTGQLPPWEAPPPPPPPPTGLSATLLYDFDGFDLDLDNGTLCPDALGKECNQGNTEFIDEPNDFWLSWDLDPNAVVFVPVLGCDDPGRTVGVAPLIGTPFASVDASWLGSLITFQEDVLEVSIGAGDTVVVRTCGLNYFKIGIVEIGTDRATIKYEQLQF